MLKNTPKAMATPPRKNKEGAVTFGKTEKIKKGTKSVFAMKISKCDSKMLNFFKILPQKLTFSTAVFEARRTFVRLTPRRTTLLA